MAGKISMPPIGSFPVAETRRCSPTDQKCLKNIPNTHWEFLESCHDLYTTGAFAFTHANFCWYTPIQPTAIDDPSSRTGVDEMEVSATTKVERL